MRFAGIDIASQIHVVAIVDESGSVLIKPTPFGEDAPGYQVLFTILGSPADILVAMEATGHYGRNLLATLHQKGFQTALLNPVRTHRFAQEDLARAKTDSIDARGIARFAAQKRPAVTPLPDQATDEMREIARLYGRLEQDLGDRVRQLHRLVDLCFPEFTRYVRTLGTLRATTILRRYPTAEAFDDSCLSSLTELRYDNGRRVVGPNLARDLLEAAKASVARHHGPAYRTEMLYLCDEIDSMRGRLHDLASDIEDRVRKHPIATLLTTIEGIAPLSAARIIAAVGDPGRFRNGAALAAYAGAVPGTRLSGLRNPGHASLCPLGNARLRRDLYMTTLGAVQRNPWLRAFYERLRANGKLPKVALLAAMRKLLIAVHSVAKSRRPFTPHTSTEA